MDVGTNVTTTGCSMVTLLRSRSCRGRYGAPSKRLWWRHLARSEPRTMVIAVSHKTQRWKTNSLLIIVIDWSHFTIYCHIINPSPPLT